MAWVCLLREAHHECCKLTHNEWPPLAQQGDKTLRFASETAATREVRQGIETSRLRALQPKREQTLEIREHGLSTRPTSKQEWLQKLASSTGEVLDPGKEVLLCHAASYNY